MPLEDSNRRIYRQVIEAINRGDVNALDALIDEDVVDHNPLPDQAPGLAGFKQWMASARSTFAGFQGTIEDLVAERDRMVGRVMWRGTHRGPFAGVPPTGKPIEFTAIHIVRLADGKIAEWWGAADLLTVVQQIGATISPGRP